MCGKCDAPRMLRETPSRSSKLDPRIVMEFPNGTLKFRDRERCPCFVCRSHGRW